MILSRREFGCGASAVAMAAPFGAPALAQSLPTDAVQKIGAYAEAHRRFFGLPGLTLGITMPGGAGTVLNFGYANLDTRIAITPNTLFQIGSISKVMTSLIIHQLAAEGRLRLADPLENLLPAIPLPRSSGITLQQLIDHTSGLADSPPLSAEGGLWTGFKPGERWFYSNTAYEILGKVAEHSSGKPLARLLQERIFAPLGMRRSRGAIVGEDRAAYAQGYEAADSTIPYARGVPLAPAAWVDVTFGAGNVASTAEDMSLFIRALAGMAQGRGGIGLTPPQALEFTRHTVKSDSPVMSYGNGLMHVANGGRQYLHHTGGMVSFTSAFHLDPASGIGAFASSTLSAFSSYRPRLLTRFAVDALAEAAAGRPVPLPPQLQTPLPNAATYAGRYSGPNGSFEIRSGQKLLLVANGQSAALQHWEGDLFRSTHPDFRAFTLKFERAGGRVTGASWGPNSFAKGGSGSVQPKSDPALARLTGRYVNDSPWWGVAFVVERGGRLWVGTESPLVPLGDNLWRIGDQTWSPERASFANFIDGRPQTLIYSGEKFRRQDI
jgi:D-alanyl-D-alanine carboxypeptidase